MFSDWIRGLLKSGHLKRRSPPQRRAARSKLAIEHLEQRLAPAASVSGHVWNDTNSDGLRDSGESDTPGAVAELFGSTNATIGDADDVSLGVQITASNGNYSFLEPQAFANYYVAFRPPVGFSFTLQDQGTDDFLDSDADPLTGLISMFAIGPNEGVVRDAGLTGATPAFGWAARAGGSNAEQGNAVALDEAGNVYVAGTFTGTEDFDPGPGAFDLTTSGIEDIFVAKYSPTGALVWARSMGGSDYDFGNALSIDSAANVYITGTFRSSSVDFDPGPGTYNLSGTPLLFNVFIVKLDYSGNFIWAQHLGGSGENSDLGIAVDAAGDVYTTGTFEGTRDFDPGSGVFNLTSAGKDVFVWKLTANGEMDWAMQFGGPGEDRGHRLAMDSAGAVHITGYFSSVADFDPGTGVFTLNSAGAFDAFVCKLGSTGDFIWAKRFGGASNDIGFSVAVDASGNVYSTGSFAGTNADFDPSTLSSFLLTSKGNTDVFVSKLNSDGDFSWAKRMGGTMEDRGKSIAVDFTGCIYTTGFFTHIADLDPGPEEFNLFYAGNEVFISKVDNAGQFVWAKRLGGDSHDKGNGIVLDSTGNIFTTGSSRSSDADFDPSSGVFALNLLGSTKAFISKLVPTFAPTDINLSVTTVPENTPTQRIIGGFSSTDADPGDTHAYRLVTGIGSDDNAAFFINSGLLWTNRVFDFETKSSYSIRIRSTDSFGQYLENVFTITVLDLDGPVVGGRVWLDEDTDGLRELSDVGIANAVVELFGSTDTTAGNGDDQSFGIQVADVNGQYQFPDAGAYPNYYLIFRPPVGYDLTLQDFGSDETIDSDADPTTGRSSLFVATIGDVLSFDVGLSGAEPAFGWAAGIPASLKAVTDDEGNVIVAGTYSSSTLDFDPGPATYSLPLNAFSKAYVAKYNSAGALIWAKGFGSSAGTNLFGLTVDAMGNVYTTGEYNTDSPSDFDPGPGDLSLDTTFRYQNDIFVSKLDGSGNLVWAKKLGGNLANDVGNAIAVDADGNVYTTGVFRASNADFDAGPDTFILSTILDGGFISKLDIYGNFVWAKKLTSNLWSVTSQTLALDGTGEIIITGTFRETVDFDPGPGVFNLSSPGAFSTFISKLAQNGNFLWAKQFSSSIDEITTDPIGNSYLTGTFTSTRDFDPGPGIYNLTSAGSADVFAAKLNAAGELAWAARTGGTTYDLAQELALDPLGNLYVASGSGTSASFSPNVWDIVITKFDVTGNRIVEGRIGGEGSDLPYPVAVDDLGNIYTAGFFAGTVDFDPSNGTYNLSGGGGFLLKLFPTFAPSAIFLSDSAIDENEPLDTAVGTLNSTDPDPNDAHTYTLVSGPGSDDNALFAIVGDTLKSAAIFDHEVKSSYSIRVRSTDLFGQFLEQALTINVANVFESTTHFVVSAPTIAGAGDEFNVTITALSATNGVVGEYAGTLQFTSDDLQAVFPTDATLTIGVGTFAVVLKTPGTHTITVTDSVTPSMTGTSDNISVVIGTASIVEGNLVLDGTDVQDDGITISFDPGANAFTITSDHLIDVSSIPGATGSGTTTVTIPASAFSGNITFNGGSGDDTLTVDYATGIITVPITFNGAVGGNDSLVVLNAPSGDSEFIYTNVHDGSIEVGGAGTITYTGLEPINFDSAGGTLTFTLTSASDDITVSVSGGDIVLTGATIETTNVDLTGISAITINSGGGTDKVTINNTLTQNVTLNIGEAVLNANIGGTVSGTASIVRVNSGAIIQYGIDVSGSAATVHVAAGTYTGDVSTAGKAITLSPGASPGQVTIDGNMTLESDDSLVIEIDGSDPLTQFDNFIVNGTVNLGLATLSTSGTRTGTAGEVLVLIKNDAIDVISGIFSGRPEGSVLVVNNVPYVITYIYNAEGSTFGDGNDVALVDITGAHYVFTTPPSTTAGALVNFAVSLLDGNSNPVTVYIGAVHITSSDPQAVLPPDALLNDGSATFSITFKTSGPQTITATDTMTSTIAGTSDAINVVHGPTTNFLVVAPSSTIAGEPFDFTVTARDVFGNTATGFTGDVAFASTGSVTLPPSSTLNSGTRTFSATLFTAGNRTITATATASAAITGTSNTIDVSPAAVSNFVVVLPSITTAGVALSGSIVARDQFNNTATNYTGTVHFSSTDPQAELPADGTLAAGTGSFETTLKTSGFPTVTASDTTTPSSTGTSGSIFVVHSATTHFTLSAPATAIAGSTFNFTVTARDAFGNTATGFTGNVTFASSGSVTLPPNSTLNSGTRTFNATLRTSGNRTITATATASAAINGTSNTIDVSPAAVSNFVVVLPSITTAGVALSGSIVARDQFNNTATNYTGTVHFSSTDPQAELPADGTLAAGTGSFETTLKTSGFHTVTASDSTTPSATGTSGTIFVFHSATKHFTVAAPTTATAGSPFNFTVTARDQFGNTTPDYLGTVHITSSDGNAALPADATLLQGVHTFSVTLKSAGNQTLTATDTTTPSLTGTSTAIAVNAANATHFVVSVPANATAGANFDVTVAARDQFNNTATGYTGTVHFTATSAGTLPLDSTLTGGVGSFSASLTAAGPRTITARDVTTASIVGTSNSITIIGAAATHFVVNIPTQFTAGAAFIAIVTAKDEFSNTATGYAGNVHFTSTDPTADLPGDSALNNGQGFFAVILTSVGPHTLTVSDIVTPTIAATSNTITVLPAAAHHFTLSAPTSASVSTPFSVTAVALDRFNNTATSYTGTVHFTSSDAGSTLPGNYQFVAGDAGVRTFTGLELTEAGNQTITVADVGSSAISGSATVNVTGGGVTHFAVSAPPNPTAGSPIVFTVIALDSLDNPVSSSATVNFSTTDSNSLLPANGTLSGGVGFFVAILRTSGTHTITATNAASAAINGTSNGINVAVAALHHFDFTGLPSTVITGNQFSFTVTAQDAFNNSVPTYNGTVQFTSNDPGGPTLPGNAALTNGVGTFSATFKTPGNRTLTATDTTTPSITGTSPIIATRGLVVSGTTPTANGFTVDFNKPFSIGTPGARILNLYDAVGAFGVSDVTLARNAIQTITFNSLANNGTFTLSFLGVTTGPITYVNTSAATLQTNIQNALNALSSVGVGNSLVTGLSATSVSVMFQGSLGFQAVAGLSASPAAVTIASTRPGTNNLRGSLLIDPDNQGMTFALSGTGTAGVLAADVYQVTIRSAANGFKDLLGSLLDGNNDGVPGDDFVTTFTVAATPTVILSIPDFARGPDSVYSVRVPNNAGEEVQTINFAGTANGSTFTLSFSGVTTGPITYSSVGTTLQGNIQTALDVLASIDNSRRAGTLIMSTNSTSATVRFMNKMGGVNQSQLATTTPTVSISTTTQGFSTGIPVTLSGATGVTGLSFDLRFDPTLLQINGTHNLATTAGPVGSTLTLTGVTPVSPAESIASFAFSIGTAPALGATATLGHIVAHVPDAASSFYKAKQLLRLTNIVATGAAAAPVGNSAVHVAAFFGDATGDGTFSGGDASAVSRVVSNIDTVPGTTQVGGLGAYPLLDPFVMTDFNNTGPTDSSDITLINSYLVRQQSQIPTPPVGFSKTDSGPDPTLSLPTDLQAAAGETVVVPVFIDITRPGDSPGMMEAILALRYDASVFTVQGITLGSVVTGLAEAGRSIATNWQLRSAVNADTGEIGINIYSMNPIQTRGGGSLVYITMLVREGAMAGSSSINLVPRVNPTGNSVYRTSVSDALDQYILYPTITDGFDPGVDGRVTVPMQLASASRTAAPQYVYAPGTLLAEGARREPIDQVQSAPFSDQFSDVFIADVFGDMDAVAWNLAISKLAVDANGPEENGKLNLTAPELEQHGYVDESNSEEWVSEGHVGYATKSLRRKARPELLNELGESESDGLEVEWK